MGATSGYHEQEMVHILKKSTYFPKNQTDVVITGTATGKVEKLHSHVWNAQKELIKDKQMTAISMNSHKLCVRASAIKVTGFVIPMDGFAKTGWNPRNPPHVSD